MPSTSSPPQAAKYGQVRVASVDDAAAIASIYAPYVTETVISFEVVPPQVEEMRQRIQKVLTMFPWLVWEGDNGIEGYAYASRHAERAAYQWSADVGIYVAQGAHRKGIGRDLYVKLLGCVAAQGVRNLYAGISLPNAASVGLHETLGFRPIGVYREVGFKMGAWRDVGWWGLTVGSAVQNPEPPRPFERLR